VDESFPVSLKCVCGHSTTTTEDWLDSHEAYKCEHCGREFNLDADDDGGLEMDFPEPEVFWYLAPVLFCECGALIELPYSNLPQTDADGKILLRGEDPPVLPSEDWIATFGCRKCGRIAIYFYGLVTVYPIPKLSEGVYQSGKGVWHAEFPCGDRRCKVLASMYVDTGNGSASEAVALLRSGIFDGTLLACGHEMKTIPEKFYRVEPVLRRLW
jgi:hypothetical protein